MGRVIVAVDPHKKSVTVEAVDDQGGVLATGRFETSTRGHWAMLGNVRAQRSHRRWAVEGGQGVGRPLAQRLHRLLTRAHSGRRGRILADVGDVARFTDRNDFASMLPRGPAPPVARLLR